ncbi:MAG: D-tyrosyl-tRNA(Tyr) deacylase [Firmicutes bacterium]|nr:D-tyrosyl-tRNA(Tyr) deacylase [Alicyclobacillaceae bacterium]MCL6496617.1 D-tyrosyl-tRNA(Tyr) deacylase [Bacillota bacterium]
MRAVVQRVRSAWVRVDGREVAAIGMGLLALVGFGQRDGPAELDWMAARLARLRVFEDETGRMARDLGAVGGALLVVPQFTLYGAMQKGFRPDFTAALDKATARLRFQEFLERVAAQGVPWAAGEFGAEMEVGLVNWGPVTIWLEREGEDADAH